MEWIIFSAADCAALADLNDATEYKVRPRLIDNPGHEFAGDFAAPGRVLDGDSGEYWRDHLSQNGRIVALPDDLFTPPED